MEPPKKPAHSVIRFKDAYSGPHGPEYAIRSSGLVQDEACLLKIDSSVDKDLAFLQRRAGAEGFQIG